MAVLVNEAQGPGTKEEFSLGMNWWAEKGVLLSAAPAQPSWAEKGVLLSAAPAQPS
jgi:hypothetical protein